MNEPIEFEMSDDDIVKVPSCIFDLNMTPEQLGVVLTLVAAKQGCLEIDEALQIASLAGKEAIKELERRGVLNISASTKEENGKTNVKIDIKINLDPDEVAP